MMAMPRECHFVLLLSVLLVIVCLPDVGVIGVSVLVCVCIVFLYEYV